MVKKRFSVPYFKGRVSRFGACLKTNLYLLASYQCYRFRNLTQLLFSKSDAAVSRGRITDDQNIAVDCVDFTEAVDR